MALEVRRIEPNEREEWIRSLHIPFLETPNEDTVRHWEEHLETDRAWLAFDGGVAVGNCCVFSRNVTVPGLPGSPCPTVPLAAISGVGVHPTHRRRGLLRRMVAVMLDDAIGHNEPVAGLLASEGSIYSRFGFGWATSSVRVSIQRRAARVSNSVPDLALRLCSAREAAERVPMLFEQSRLRRPGEIDRNAASWSDLFGSRRVGTFGERYFAVGDEGYVIYRTTSTWSSEPTVLRVDDLAGVTVDAESGLWQYLLGIDLIDSIVANRPFDEPLRWRLEDPRALTVTSWNDRLWIRLLDVPAALTARRYITDGCLVLQVDPAAEHAAADGDPAPDPIAGRWVLDVGPDGASCRPALRREQPDLRMSATALGSVFLGGQEITSLAAAGLVTELQPGTLARAELLFRSHPLPFSSTGF